MEMVQNGNITTSDPFTNINLIDVLKEINISAFIDKWGPAHVLQIYDKNINMQGILVLDNIALGPACGGIKISPTVTPREIFQSARNMTWSCALVNINFGGASACIKANPSEIDKIQFIKSFGKEVSPYVPSQYIAAPGLNIGQEEMSAFVEEIGDRQGATGKPENIGGIPYELGVIGLGIGVAIETITDMVSSSSGISTDISEIKIAIQGFRDIGCTVAKYLDKKGAKVVAISDEWCAIRDSKGIDINKTLKYSSANVEKKSLKHCKNIEKIPRDDIIKTNCDIFVLTTGNKIVTEENVQYLKTKFVVEGVNNAITPIADQILHKRGILILPDILATAGGAISSYAEYNRNSCEMAFSLIESKIKESTEHVIQQSLKLAIPLRRVATEIAKERVLQAMEEAIK